MQQEEQKYDHSFDKGNKYLSNFDDNIKTLMIIPPSQINSKDNRYPYCIVWTPIPFVSHFFPFIGHTGICT